MSSIVKIVTTRESVPLTRPYLLARGSYDAVELLFCRIETSDGLCGFGSGSPAEDVTGESVVNAAAALGDGRLDELIGRDAADLGERLDDVERLLPRLPAARAALDGALHDLLARKLGRPLANVLGRAHASLPTSITIGIKDVAATVAEAEEYRGRGFFCFKVKLGRDVDVDLARLHALRQRFGDAVRLRVDANEGYDLAATTRLLADSVRLDLELVEQPLPRGEERQLAALTAAERRLIAFDESVHDAAELAVSLPIGVGGAVVKLMKCGGLRAALRMAAVAEAAHVDLMWGCMDESTLSIGHALAAALSSPATRWLDLDGHLDLARDPHRTDFILDKGRLGFA